MEYRIPLSADSFGQEEREAVEGVMASGRYTQGGITTKFEQEFARYIGADHAIMVNSGSSANLVGITATYYASLLDGEDTYGMFSTGDEVVIPALCWPTTLTPLLNVNLRPVFCDIELDSLNMSVEKLENVRTDRTRAVIAIPVLGNPTGLSELRDYCDAEDLVLIENSCESLGAVGKDGEGVGTFGLVSSFSFFFSHHISTIEGGCIVTNSSLIADLCRSLRAHGWTRDLDRTTSKLEVPALTGGDQRFEFFLPGYNVRATDVAASIGRAQLKKFSASLDRRKNVARRFNDALAPHADRVSVPGAGIKEGHSWMAFPMIFESSDLKDHAQKFLEDHLIETRCVIAGNVARHQLSRFLGDSCGSDALLENSDCVFYNGLMIGVDPELSARDLDFVIDVFGRLMEDSG